MVNYALCTSTGMVQNISTPLTFIHLYFLFLILANSYFQFKQFTIRQDKCAMKVTTDGCLFGAIVATEISDKGASNVLDIGTGTGLLSLMVMQQNSEAIIDAVEIDEAAVGQAKENAAASDWSGNVNILHTDILDYLPSLQYDYIICNPPFHEQQLGSPNENRQLAHHSSRLILKQLFAQVKILIKQERKFYVLLPFYRKEEAIASAIENRLFLEKQWLIRQTPKHNFFRTVLVFTEEQLVLVSSTELIIRDRDNYYTEEFKRLLYSYYLKL